MSGSITMPALSPTMTEGKLAKWLVAEGDAVASGDVIAEIETDKAMMEVEALDDGVITALKVKEGEDGIAVGSVIATISVEGGSVEGGSSEGEAKPQAKSPTKAPVAPTPTPTPAEEAARYTASSDAGEMVDLTVREALRDAMAEEMRRDDSVFLIGEEVAEYEGAYKVSQGLLAEFSAKRVIDTPITEMGFTGLGVGAAFTGLKPIVEFMTFNFAMQAIDHIINSAAKTLYMSGGQMGCPIVFRGPNGAAARVAAQHSQCYASWYAHCPGLKVVAPWSAADAKGLLKAAIRDPNPVVFLENEVLYGQSFPTPTDPDWLVPIGKANILEEGSDVTIVAFSIMVGKALTAAQTLAEAGISAEVIDLRSLRPLDSETIFQSIRKTNRLIVCEEGFPFSGIGSEIITQVIEGVFDWLDAPPVRVTGADVPTPYAANLEALALPQSDNIVAAAQQLLGG
ncbi:MAG: pyruvate dehydrogenase complex E1 component subunit beta [Proteobacteria bacterium]|nr:pyruvate dehydrogenase complex E1 component subunit beta [Pseudomonadota bacterium]